MIYNIYPDFITHKPISIRYIELFKFKDIPMNYSAILSVLTVKPVANRRWLKVVVPTEEAVRISE